MRFLGSRSKLRINLYLNVWLIFDNCQNPGWQPTGLLVALSQFPYFNGISCGFASIALADKNADRETCNRARRKELAQMRIIQERYPHRHVSKLQKSGQDSEVREGEQRSSWGAECHAWLQSTHLNNSRFMPIFIDLWFGRHGAGQLRITAKKISWTLRRVGGVNNNVLTSAKGAFEEALAKLNTWMTQRYNLKQCIARCVEVPTLVGSDSNKRDTISRSKEVWGNELLP